MEYFTKKEAYEIIADLIEKADPNAEVVMVLHQWAINLKGKPYISDEEAAGRALINYMHRLKVDKQSLITMLWMNSYMSEIEYTNIGVANELERSIVFDAFITLDNWNQIIQIGVRPIKEVKSYLLSKIEEKVENARGGGTPVAVYLI